MMASFETRLGYHIERALLKRFVVALELHQPLPRGFWAA
jgi:hypothetical protein